MFNLRKDFSFIKEHIPGAINLPHRMMSEGTIANFSKDALYIIYCDGIGCNASTSGVLKMAKISFNVRELLE